MTTEQINAPTTLAEGSVAELAETLRGELIGPADAGYDEARSIWNGVHDRRPALIAALRGRRRRDARGRVRPQRAACSSPSAAAPLDPRLLHLRRRHRDRPLADEGHPRGPGGADRDARSPASPGPSSTTRRRPSAWP